MRRFYGLLLCTFLAAVSVVAFATERTSTPAGIRDFHYSEANLAVSSVTPALTTITLEAPRVLTQEQTVGYQTYQSFGIAGEASLDREGAPTVPQVSRFYRILNTGGVDLVITSAQFDLVENVNPYPIQSEQPGFLALTRDENLYSADGWYPRDIATISDPMLMRDFRVVGVTLCPVQVNPVTHQARIYRQISVDVVANSLPAVNELLHPRRPSAAWAPLYRSAISNLDDNALDDVTTTPGSYLIISTTGAVLPQFVDSLFQWKTRKGFRVVVDARASWTALDIKNAIQAAYANWDPPLEYVALMGDPSLGVPADGSNYDHAYALGNAGDDLEDISVGRLSGSSGAEMMIINNKIMAYERNPLMTDTLWYHKAFLYAGIGNQCAGNYTLMNWGRQQFQNNTAVNNVTVLTADYSVDETAVRNQIDGGVGFFIWRGSYVGQMSSTLAASTNPQGRFPICMTVTCGTGDFTSGGACVSESWLVAGSGSTPVGGVCGIATATLSTHNPENTCLTSGLMYNITDLNVEAIGTALAGAKAQLYYTYGTQEDPYGGTLAGNFSRYCNLMGEPSLSMWTDVPEALTVTHPTSLNVGARQVTVNVRRTADNVPIQDALVVLWKRGTDSTWVRGNTDASGNITLPVHVNTAGNLFLTVTKRNHKPYLYTLNCVPAAAMPMLSTYSLDDDNIGGTQGNGNLIMNPSETIDLPVYVKNFGSATTATGISATLTSADPRITVVNASATYANLAIGDSALGSAPFRIVVGASLPNQAQVNLTMTINSSAGQTVGTIPLVCQAGEGLYVRQHLSTSLDPGTSANLTVVMKNVGPMTMTGVSGHLVSLDPYITVSDADASFGDMAFGVSDSNRTDGLTVSAITNCFRGHQAPMRLVLTSSAGFVDTLQFLVSVGTALVYDPTGPDAFGYFAYDNQDTTYNLRPAFNYVDVSSFSADNLNIEDSGDKTAPLPVWSAVRRLPFGFKFYGRVYDSITVCSNGWCAFGDQSWYDGFRNYQIPAMQAPAAMIAPYWDDLETLSGEGHGVWAHSDPANHRYIVQWKANTMNSSENLDFEVILYDTSYVPTADGNGRILVQYNDIVMNAQHRDNDEAPGSTIGIQAPGCVVGLQIAYEDSYTPGSAIVQNGRAILFTTDTTSNIPAPFTLLSPNAGALWFQNVTDTITWFVGDNGGNVHIELSRNGVAGPWENVTASTPNDGLFTFTPVGPASTTCRMRIQGIEHPTDADTSNGNFTISALRLVQPDGGNVWMLDSTTTITWQGAAPLASIHIELSRSGVTGPWENITTNAPNTGSYSWVVTGPSCSDARIRITSNLDGTDTDVSAASFLIEYVQTIFSEDFESGATGWNHGSTGGTWVDNWHLSTDRAFNGTTSYKCGGTGAGSTYSSLCDAWLTSPVIPALPANATLVFEYFISSEMSSSWINDSCYDGGLLEVALDGGAFTQFAPDLSYPVRFRTRAGSSSPYTGPMGGQPCWGDTNTVTWRQVPLSLSTLAGHSVQLRWRFGSDANTNREGWYVDDVHVYSPAVAPPTPTVPTQVTITVTGNDLHLRWADDGNIGYKVYSSTTGNGPCDTYEGSSLTNDFVVVGGATASRKFYTVVGWNGQ